MAEKIPVQCDSCGKKFNAPGELAGQKARCPCGEVIDVPGEAEPESQEEEAQWYYAKDGDRKGPVPLSEMLGLFQEDELSPSDYVWRQGLEAWQPAEEVDELAEALSGAEAEEPAEEAEPAEEEEETEEEPADEELEEEAEVEGASA